MLLCDYIQKSDRMKINIALLVLISLTNLSVQGQANMIVRSITPYILPASPLVLGEGIKSDDYICSKAGHSCFDVVIKLNDRRIVVEYHDDILMNGVDTPSYFKKKYLSNNLLILPLPIEGGSIRFGLSGSPNQVIHKFPADGKGQKQFYSIGIRERNIQMEKSEIARGIKTKLVLKSDVDADIYVAGRFVGKANTELIIDPGLYSIRMQHQVGENSAILNVPKEIEKLEFEMLLRKKRSTAFFSSLVLPGVGQIYKGNVWRGLLFVSALGFGAFQLNTQLTKEKQFLDEVDNLTRQLVLANTSSRINQLRSQILVERENAKKAANNASLIGFAMGFTYVWQLFDSFVSSPEYGFRYDENKKIKLKTSINTISFSYKF